jgi:hypothetical protein
VLFVGASLGELPQPVHFMFIIDTMEDDICMVTYFPGSRRKEPEITVEKRKGASYTLRGKDANLQIVGKKLVDDGWILEQYIAGIPDIYIL